MSLIPQPRNVPTLPAPIFKLLAEREEGLLRSLALQRAVTQVRAEQIQLNSRRIVERPHDFPIYCMAMEEVEDRYLLCGYGNGALGIVDVENVAHSSRCQLRTVIKIPPGAHKYGITGVAWYPMDTGMFVSASFDKTIKVWDTNEAKHAFTFNIGDKLYALSMPGSETRHALIAGACADQRIYLCDIRLGTKHQTLQGHTGAVLSVAWSPRDEFILASGGQDGSLRIWDVRKARSCLAMLRRYQGPDAPSNAADARSDAATAIAHEGGVRAILYAQGGRQLLSSGCDGRIRLWNPDSGRNVLVNYGSFPRAAGGSGGWRGGFGNVQMASRWDGVGGGVVYHPYGREVVACCIESGRRLGSLSAHQEAVTCCAVQRGTEHLLSAGRDGNILVWSPPAALHPADSADGEDSDGLGQDAWSDPE